MARAGRVGEGRSGRWFPLSRGRNQGQSCWATPPVQAEPTELASTQNALHKLPVAEGWTVEEIAHANLVQKRPDSVASVDAPRSYLLIFRSLTPTFPGQHRIWV